MKAVFQHVLVAVDGSATSTKPVELALRLGLQVTALLVAHDYGLPEYLRVAVHGTPNACELREEIAAEGRRSLDAALARVEGAERIADRRVMISDKAPCHVITDLARREICDLIVMGAHGAGHHMPSLVGSQAQAVLALAAVPVLVVR